MTVPTVPRDRHRPVRAGGGPRLMAGVADPSAPGPGRSHRFLAVATMAVGVAAIAFVTYDGSVAWQLARGSVVVLATMGVLAWLSRCEERLAGRIAGAIGVAAVVVGLAFLPHLVKSGSSTLSVAAVSSTAAGLMLLGAGAAVASRGRGALRRAATGFGAVVVLVVTAMVVTPSIMATNVPRPDLGATPDSHDLMFRDVELTTADGVRLAAWYVPATNRAAVVLLHGAGSTRSNVLDHADVLARHGFGVLMLDARGHGRSDGRAMDFGWLGDADIGAATAFLADQPEVDPDQIGAVGLSMGGEEALGAAATNRHLRAVVAEGATARVAADEAWLSDQYGLRGRIQEQLERAQDVITDLLTASSAPIALHDAVADAPDVKFLLIAAGQIPEEGYAMRYVASAAPERVTMWTVEDAGHTEGLTRAPREWEAQVVAFLDETLRS